MHVNVLTVAYVYQMKALQKKHVFNVQQVNAIKPNETRHFPSLFSFSPTTRVFERRGMSVCRSKMELSVYWGEVKEEEEVLQNLTTFSSST